LGPHVDSLDWVRKFMSNSAPGLTRRSERQSEVDLDFPFKTFFDDVMPGWSGSIVALYAEH